jgi:hypothetical protein
MWMFIIVGSLIRYVKCLGSVYTYDFVSESLSDLRVKGRIFLFRPPMSNFGKPVAFPNISAQTGNRITIPFGCISDNNRRRNRTASLSTLAEKLFAQVDG